MASPEHMEFLLSSIGASCYGGDARGDVSPSEPRRSLANGFDARPMALMDCQSANARSQTARFACTRCGYPLRPEAEASLQRQRAVGATSRLGAESQPLKQVVDKTNAMRWVATKTRT